MAGELNISNRSCCSGIGRRATKEHLEPRRNKRTFQERFQRCTKSQLSSANLPIVASRSRQGLEPEGNLPSPESRHATAIHVDVCVVYGVRHLSLDSSSSGGWIPHPNNASSAPPYDLPNLGTYSIRINFPRKKAQRKTSQASSCQQRRSREPIAECGPSARFHQPRVRASGCGQEAGSWNRSVMRMWRDDSAAPDGGNCMTFSVPQEAKTE